MLAAVAVGHADDTGDLAKAAQNPVANMISLPFQYNASFDWGPEEGTLHVLNIQPVLPFSNGKINFINRTIVPVVQQPELTPGQGSKFGLGDITHTLFLSPAAPSAFTWGAGPVLSMPTATDDRLGSDTRWVPPFALTLCRTRWFRPSFGLLWVPSSALLFWRRASSSAQFRVAQRGRVQLSRCSTNKPMTSISVGHSWDISPQQSTSSTSLIIS